VSRRGSFIALALSVALVAGSVVALVGGVALGAWQPAGPPRPTPAPTPFPGSEELTAFLDEVRAGLVVAVVQEGAELSVDGIDRDYVLQLPSESFDIFSAMEAAARDGGVPMPEITISGPKATSLTYPEFLGLVRAGRIVEVFHQGDVVNAYAEDMAYEVRVPAGVVSVLGDIEAAAAEGSVRAPNYQKVAGKPPA
jgi:hypothetical protein